MSLQYNSKLAKKIYELFNDDKIEEFADLYSESCTLLQVPTNQVFKGREGVVQAAKGWKTAFSDAKCEVKNQVVTEDFIITEFNGVGTNDGKLETPMGTIPPTGKNVNIPFIEVMKVKNGKIDDYKLYFDTATMMQQLELTAEKV